jgi:betaine-aldehyde dehydrogenase
MVDKVSFTGSTATGKWIASECAGDLKRVQLELGGKSGAIVLDDADLEAVVPILTSGAFSNSGQICAALTRVLAPESLCAEITERLAVSAKALRVGDPFDETTEIGPLVSARQRHRVENYIAIGRSEGAQLAAGGGRPAIDRGWYVEPTVFADVDNSMRVAREEIFGPVAVVIPFRSEADAVTIANDSEYGLHGAVFTTDADRALSIARQVRTGTFSINRFQINMTMPFGGFKNSGLGREFGLEGLETYSEIKCINASRLIVNRIEPETDRSAMAKNQPQERGP